MNVAVDPSISIAALKDKIAVEQKLPASQQDITWNGVQLEESKTLAECAITGGEVLKVSLKLMDSYKVLVKHLTGKISPVDVKSTMTVRSLKEKMQAILNIAGSQLDFLFNGQHLVDTKTMADYNIKDQDTIFMVLKLV